MGIFKKISKRLLLIINSLLVLVFLVACISPYISPMEWPLFSLLGLAFPFLLFLVIIFGIGWLFLKKRWALISGIALALGFGEIQDFFAFRYPRPFVEAKNPQNIRVATWNVARFVELIKNNNKGSQTRYKMLQQIKETNADILCLQEFSTSINPDWYNNIVAVGQGLGYPFHYYSHEWDGNTFYNGSVIFSRYPIADTGMIRFPRPTLPEALVFVDIRKGKDLLRVYTAHLQSNQFKKQDLAKIEDLKNVKSPFFYNAFYVFRKLSTAIRHRSIQADIIGEVVHNSPYPVILCADLNDVPNSYCYKKVRQHLNDVFLKKGFGVGRTYNGISPTLRIDYIFTDGNYKIQQFKRVTTSYSDHYMLVCDLEL